eukprot:1158456-Pelagomonas_calceolata.AAC.2
MPWQLVEILCTVFVEHLGTKLAISFFLVKAAASLSVLIPGCLSCVHKSALSVAKSAKSALL